MNLKVPGAILPLGCAILSTRAITVNPPPHRRTRVNDDYRLTHNRKYHSDILKQNKLVRYKEANAPENPFVAAASASRKKAPSLSSTSETLSQPGKSSLFC